MSRRRTQDAPEYRPGIYACIACALMNMLVVLVLGGFFRVANRRAARGEIVLEDSDVSLSPFQHPLTLALAD